MAAPNLSNDAQVRYMIQWFEEWSELQRQDFLPILAEKVAANGAYINGIVNSLNAVNCEDKPMNLFQCRVKLFHDWFTNWTNDDRDKLVNRISEIDEDFGKKLQDEITGNKQVIDGEPSQEEAVLVTAQPGNVVSENGTHEEEEAEVENHEVIEDQLESPQIHLAESSLPIQITAE